MMVGVATAAFGLAAYALTAASAEERSAGAGTAAEGLAAAADAGTGPLKPDGKAFAELRGSR